MHIWLSGLHEMLVLTPTLELISWNSQEEKNESVLQQKFA